MVEGGWDAYLSDVYLVPPGGQGQSLKGCCFCEQDLNPVAIEDAWENPVCGWNRSPRYLTVGQRYEFSFGGHVGLDINFEQHCTLTGGMLGFPYLPKPKCGWFANVSYVGNTSFFSANATFGVVLGYIGFPEEAGTTFVYALGGDIAALGALEFDVTRSVDGEYVIFGGIGSGIELGILTGFGLYGTIGASVYMGPQFYLPMTPRKSWRRLLEVITFLADGG